jgi:apolipoprotein N-acyltransferase
MLMRMLSAVLAGLLLAAAFPLSLPDITLGGGIGELSIGIPGWQAAGYGQVAWFAFVALIPLLEVARRSGSDLEAFCWGYLCSLVWLVPHWIWLSSFGWLPVLLLAAFFGLPVGLAALLFRRLALTRHPSLILWGVPAIWTALEYLRSFGFWAFPWNLLGYSQVHNLSLIQIADIGGVYLVSFVIVLVNAALWLLLTPLGRLRTRLGLAALTGGLLLLALAYGEFRQAGDYSSLSRLPLRLALVQGGMETRERWSDDRLSAALEAYLPLSEGVLDSWDEELRQRREAQAGRSGPRRLGELLLVWPEGALPKGMDQRHAELVPYDVRTLLNDHDNAALLMGALGRPVRDKQANNGCLLIEGDGEMSWPYSKVRLVPYGEVVPLREVARFLDYPWGNFDLSAGRSTAPLNWRGHRLGLLICFDNVFSFVARREVQAGAGALVLMTNNSWYNLASGIRQHCDIDVLRAIEYRRPLARVSTTGWSQLVAPDGSIPAQTEVYSDGLLEASLWPGGQRTLYLLLGDLFAQLCLLASAVLVLRLLVAGESEGIL